MAMQQSNPDIPEDLAKNVRIMKMFLLGLNIVVLILIPLTYFLKIWAPMLSLTLALLLFFWDWSGYRIIQKMSKGDTSF